jgi:LacI family transcriptional regulator
MAKRVTIKDVAAQAGVSYQTVSRVINDKGEVSPEVRTRVHAAIADLGYRPSAIARSMVRGRTRTLGCIAPNLTDYTFACILEGAKSEARQHGYFLLTSSAEHESEAAALCDEMLSSGRVDGLFVINPYADERYRCFEQSVAHSAAIVYSGARSRHPSIPSVRLDDETGGYQATRHLIALGHRHIAVIAGPASEDCVTDRSAGYVRALAEVGQPYRAEWIVHGDWSATAGYDAMQHLINSGFQFSALFAQNDRMAVGAIKAARERGWGVPHNLAVVGFDDMPLASYFDPPLTTVCQNILEHGRQAARLLIERIENPQAPVRQVVIPCELVVRQSCGAK